MAAPITPAVALDELLDRLGGRRQLVGQLFAVFEQSAPSWLQELDAACRAGDAERLRKTAHSAKGALATLAAVPAAELAKSLEDLGKSGDLANAPAGIARFSAELERVREAFRSILAENAKPDF